MDDPKGRLQEAIDQIRSAMRDLRESVVQMVMRRNMLADQAEKLEKLSADLDTKAALAEKINNPSLAAELRQERQRLDAERERLRGQLAVAETEANAAKAGLPEQEGRLLAQLNELKARFAQGVGAHLESGGAGSEAESLWERATNKVQNLTNEASARSEVSSVGSPAAPPPPAPAPEQSAEAMLAALEDRLGLAPEPPPPPVLELPVPVEAPAPVPLVEPVAPPPPPPAQTTESPASASAPQWNITVKPEGEKARMEPTQRVRVAGIGTGGIFRGAHMPAYVEIPQAQLVALCDPDKEAQDLAYKRFQSLIETKIEQAKERNDLATIERLERDLEDVQIVEDISQVIEKIKPDLVDVCTQPFLHAPLSIQALEAGIHVMCEKPISRSWLETERLIPTIQRAGKFYQHNENWLWDKDYYTARKLVTSGAIGEVILMFLAQAHGGPEGNPRFWDSDMGGGGALLDNGVHAIGAAWFICGLEKQPTYVKAAEPFGMSIRMPERIIDGHFQQVRVDDDAHILIRFEDPKSKAWATAHVEGSWSERDSPDTAIIGTTGKIIFRNEDGRRYAVVLDAYDREMRRLQVSGPTWQPWPSSHYGEMLDMVQCVRYNKAPFCTAEFGADNSAIVGATYLSEKQGKRPVHLDEFKAFAREIAARYPNDPKGADDALVDSLLSAVREKGK